jgi:hypothetical protein
MLASRNISISIARNWKDVYAAIWRPEDFPKWASGLSSAQLTTAGETWKGQGPEGPITIRFTPHNQFGVMDHYVDTGTAPEIYVPLRVIENGGGAEVQLTLFRQPGMSMEQFEADAEMVGRDLQALKELLAP